VLICAETSSSRAQRPTCVILLVRVIGISNKP
jgi:hypothetical protein